MGDSEFKVDSSHQIQSFRAVGYLGRFNNFGIRYIKQYTVGMGNEQESKRDGSVNLII